MSRCGIVFLTLLCVGAIVAAHPPTERQVANGLARRMPDGRPDLQGVWNYATITPLERPLELADRSYLSDAEAAGWVAKLRATRNSDIRDPKNPVNDLARETNDFWQEHPTQMARINGRFATALIVDPPNGRVPVLAKTVPAGLPGTDNPEDRLLGERCLFDSAGPPIVGNVPNSTSYLRIVQTPTHVALHTEVSNTARIIPVGTTRERDPAIRLWRGASVGRWEGTLYEFTVTNSKLFSRPWTAQLPMTRSNQRMFENACHEGNSGLEFILRGARAEEKERER